MRQKSFQQPAPIGAIHGLEANSQLPQNLTEKILRPQTFVIDLDWQYPLVEPGKKSAGDERLSAAGLGEEHAERFPRPQHVSQEFQRAQMLVAAKKISVGGFIRERRLRQAKRQLPHGFAVRSRIRH